MNMEKKNNQQLKTHQPTQKSKPSKKVGTAKKEMEGFDISLEEFNSIEINEFGQ